MKFLVDTADVAEFKDLTASGLLDGMTTNPSLKTFLDDWAKTAQSIL